MNGRANTAGAPGCLSEEDALRYASGGEAASRVGPIPAHLDQCGRCRALVAAAVQAFTPASQAPAPRELRTLQEGEVVRDRYRIEHLLGSGGMGEVYRAWDSELGTSVALKTLAVTILDNANAVARLKSEVQLARQVTHPNVCRIFEFGVHERRPSGGRSERTPFLTMELLGGETLGRRLARVGPLSADAAEPIVRGILSGLDAVHRANVIHRDFKSENVFLATSPDGPWRVVLMDFGLARSTALPAGVSFASMHGPVGTVGYMSPEQVEGKPLTVASDIYSLGIVLYEMRTGHLPFSGPSALSMAAARLHLDPAPIRSYAPDIEPVWERVILKCLARNPADRFPDVNEVGDALFSTELRPSRSPWITLIAAAAAAGAIGAFALRQMKSSSPSPVVHAVPAPVAPAPAPAPPAPSPQPAPPPPPVVAPEPIEAPATPERSAAVEKHSHPARVRAPHPRPASAERPPEAGKPAADRIRGFEDL